MQTIELKKYIGEKSKKNKNISKSKNLSKEKIK